MVDLPDPYEQILFTYTEEEILEIEALIADWNQVLSNGAIRWNKEFEFLIERSGKIVSYGEN